MLLCVSASIDPENLRSGSCFGPRDAEHNGKRMGIRDNQIFSVYLPCRKVQNNIQENYIVSCFDVAKSPRAGQESSFLLLESGGY